MIRRHLSEVDLIEYADGTLSGARLSAAYEHLRGCQTCTETLQTLRTASDAVQIAVSPPLPYDLRQRIVARIAAEPAPSISCREARQLLHRSLDEKLAPLTAGMLALHLESCETCRQEQAALVLATHAVRSLPTASAPARVRHAVFSAPREARTPVAWGRRLRPALAATAMAAGALVTALHFGGQPPLPITAARPVPTKVAMQPTPAPTPIQVASAQASAPELKTPEATMEQPLESAQPRARTQPAYRMASVALAADEAGTRPAREVRRAPMKQLAVHYAAPEPTVSAAKPTPRAFRALLAVAQAAEAPTPQSRMMEAADPYEVMKDEDRGLPKVFVARPVEAGGTGSTTSAPLPGRDPSAGSSAPRVRSSAAGSGPAQWPSQRTFDGTPRRASEIVTFQSSTTLHSTRHPGRSLLLVLGALCWLFLARGSAWAFGGGSAPGLLLPELKLSYTGAVIPTLGAQSSSTEAGSGLLGQVQLKADGQGKLNLSAFSYAGKALTSSLAAGPALGLQGVPAGMLSGGLGLPLNGGVSPLSAADRATRVKADYGTARAKFGVSFYDVGNAFPTSATALQGVEAADLEALKKLAGQQSMELTGALALGSAANLSTTRTSLYNDKQGDGNRGLTTTDWANTLALNLGKNSALKLSLTDHDESWDPGLGKKDTSRTTSQIGWDTAFGKGGANSFKFGLTDVHTKSGDTDTSEKTEEMHLALAPAARMKLTEDYVTKLDGAGKATTTSTFGTVLQVATGSELTTSLKTTFADGGSDVQERYLKLTSDLGHGSSTLKLFAEQKLTSADGSGQVTATKLELTGGLGVGNSKTNLHALLVENRGTGETGALDRTSTFHLDRKFGKRVSVTADREEAEKGTLGQPIPTMKTALVATAALTTQTTLTAGLSSQEAVGSRFTSQDLALERKVGLLVLHGEEHRRDDPTQTSSSALAVDLPKGKLPEWAANITRKHEFTDIYDYFWAREASWLDLPFAGMRFWMKQRRTGPDAGLDTRLLSYRGLLARRLHVQLTTQDRPEAEDGDLKGRPQNLRRQYAEIGTPVSSGLVGRGWLMNERSLTDAASRRRTLGLGVTGKIASGAQTEVDYSETHGIWQGKPADRQAVAMFYARKVSDENQVGVKIACAWGNNPTDDKGTPEYRLSLQYKKAI